ncbi:hypothetical protein NMG60_11031917 [Bertholletia excelsa]
MYPSLKVREVEEGPRFLEGFESLSVRDSDSSVRKCEDDSPCPKVRVPKCYISISSIPAIPLPKGEGKNNNKKKDEEDSKPKIRASSVPQPRAVLSSPDNDGMIGGRNKTKLGLLSGLKDYNLCQDRHTRCKVMSRPNTVGTPTAKRRESKKAADGKIGLKEKRGATTVDTTQRTPLRKAKPDWVF